jgi:hypothetical protein
MVETVIDPIRMPTVTLSQAELDEIDQLILAGQLPPDWIARYYAAVRANVFGHDHKTDRHGEPIEQGRGSAGNQTQQSLDAFKKFCSSEPNFSEHLALMEKQLAACNELRAEAGAARRKEAGARR